MAAAVFLVDNWQASDGSKYTGRRLRQFIGALVGGKTAARPLGARSGVVAGTPASTVTATSTVCTIASHAGVIDAQTLAIAGPYFYAFDASLTRPIAAPHQTLARVDLVAVQISDPTEGDGTSAPGVDVVYVTGTPGAGAPAVPARSLLLATVGVPAVGGGAPAVTWVAPYTVALGGVLPVTGAGQYPAAPFDGQCIYDQAADALLAFDGSAWRSFLSPQAYYVTRTTDLNVPNNTPSHVVSYDGPTYTAGVDITFAGGVFTVKRAGLYQWDATAGFAGPTGSYKVGLWVEVNGAAKDYGRNGERTNLTQTNIISAGGPLALNANDTVQLVVFQNSGASMTTQPESFCLRRAA